MDVGGRDAKYYDFQRDSGSSGAGKNAGPVHWQHIRTTNPVESPFATARLRTDAAKRFKRVENATAVLWKMLLVAETRFRRLKHLDLLERVYRGVEYVDGLPKTRAAA